MLASAALVLLMTPGLAFFYGGMVRAKSVLNMMMMSFVSDRHRQHPVGALRLLAGLRRHRQRRFWGGLDDVGLGETPRQDRRQRRRRLPIPILVFAAFQLMFAIITVALIRGAIADRAKFGAWVRLRRALGRRSSTSRSRTGCSTSAADRQGGGWLATTAASRTSPVAPWSTSTPAPRASRWPSCSASASAGQGPDAAAQPAAGAARRRPAVVRLVRLQRRLRRSPRTTTAASRSSTPRSPPPPACSAGCSSRSSATATPPPSVPPPAPSPAWSRSPRPVRSSTPWARSSLGLIAGAVCACAVGLKYKLGFDDSLDVVGVHLVGGIVGCLLARLLRHRPGPADATRRPVLRRRARPARASRRSAPVAVLAYSFIVACIIG